MKLLLGIQLLNAGATYMDLISLPIAFFIAVGGLGLLVGRTRLIQRDD